MSLIDQIKARPENLGSKAPGSSKPEDKVEVSKEEVATLNAELEKEAKSESTPEDKPEEESLTPEQIEARTKDSYEDEIKKLREENAKRRKKEQEAKEKALKIAEEVYSSEREQYESEKAALKKELEDLKALKKEEKQVEEEIKSAESNAEVQELKAQLAELKVESDKIKAEAEERKQKEEDEKALRKQAAENRFKSLLSEIPEEYKDYASAMFKGYSDQSEGLIAITKAKSQGIFGKRTIEVVSQIPKDNHNENKDSPLSKRQKHQKRVEALAKRRQGLQAGDQIVGPKAR